MLSDNSTAAGDRRRARALGSVDDLLEDIQLAEYRRKYEEQLEERRALEREEIRREMAALKAAETSAVPIERRLAAAGLLLEQFVDGVYRPQCGHEVRLAPFGEVEARKAGSCAYCARILERVGEPSTAEMFAGRRDAGPRECKVIPGVLDAQERVILTGWEGSGKTTFLRQSGLQVASGIHPFTLEPIQGLKVVYVDLEVGRDLTIDEFLGMGFDGRVTGDGSLDVYSRIDGLDLGGDDGDFEWLRRKVEGADLLCVGPIYKMTSGDLAEESVALEVLAALDEIRADGTALLIEAHQPQASASGGRTMRVQRPYGSSAFLRWPEFGLHLRRDGRLDHWRAPRVRGRAWPARLVEGETWPWEPVVADMKAVVDEARRESAGELKALELLRASGGMPKTALAKEMGGNYQEARNTVDGLIESGRVLWDGGRGSKLTLKEEK